MLAENSRIQRGETQVRVTVSLRTTMAVPIEAADDLVDRADRFMCASKQGGRNRVTTDTGGSPAQRANSSLARPSPGRCRSIAREGAVWWSWDSPTDVRVPLVGIVDPSGDNRLCDMVHPDGATVWVRPVAVLLRDGSRQT